MRTYLQGILGTYTPLVDQSGNYVTTLAGVDWEYVIGGILLIVCFSFIFKCLFSIFYHK